MPVHACGSKCAHEGTSSEADLARGGVSPRVRRTLLEGAPCWAALVGRGGYRGVGCAVCACLVLGSRCVCVLRFLQVLSRIPPWFFRGPSWLSPTVAPEHLWVYRSGSPRCWRLLIGRSSLPVANAFPWGRVSGPAGLAPEALQECECSCRGFLAEFYQRAWYMSQPASVMFQPASVTHAQLISFAFGASQEV
jgi:hypothetical protein